MPTSFKVQVWALDRYVGARGTRYIVRWAVDGRRHKTRFATKALAEVFRAELLSAQRHGVAFDVATGLPLTRLRAEADTTTWYEFACSYVDLKWPTISPKHRKGIAEVLTTATIAQLTVTVTPEQARPLRSALLNWGFNRRRGSREQPAEVTRQLQWIGRHSRPVADFAQPAVIRAILDAGATKVDGTRASGRTATWKRSVVSTALKHAVERGLLKTNPVASISWKAPRTSHVIDRRSVVNPTQAEVLLDAVRGTPRSGPRLVAFFAALYYSALRPEEAATLRRRNLDLPADGGWGWITLDAASAEVDRQWTDSGARREERELKHRAVGDVRRVPCPPPLTLLLADHLATYGTDTDGRLFRGERGGPLAGVTYTRVWARARAAAVSTEQAASPLGRRPYDLRHAAVSTWLNGGVAPTQVAEWAGHSVEVLLRVYAKCLDGGETVALDRIATALHAPPPNRPANAP